jgi:hypothetical protein
MILVGKPERKRPLRRQRCRWVGNMKMVVGGRMWDGMDWIGVSQVTDKWRIL